MICKAYNNGRSYIQYTMHITEKSICKCPERPVTSDNCSVLFGVFLIVMSVTFIKIQKKRFAMKLKPREEFPTNDVTAAYCLSDFDESTNKGVKLRSQYVTQIQQ